MAAGKTYPPEKTTFMDARSGLTLTRWTDHLCHSHHLYFTNSGWFRDGKSVVFGSDRNNETGLYSLDLETGGIRQLLDLHPSPHPEDLNFQGACLNPQRDEAYFWWKKSIHALDMATGELRSLFELPPGFAPSILSATADGRFVCAAMYEDMSSRIRLDLERGYVGFRELSAAHPLSKIVAVNARTSDHEILHEERNWIGHVNASPRNPRQLTFCHEGPWNMVDHRIWGLDLETREAWRIRETQTGETVGHEYWYADGERIGYHGSGKKAHFFGYTYPDNSDRVEAEFPGVTGHVHSNDERFIVGDGGGAIRLWRLNVDEHEYEGPFCLCEHRCSMHVQKLHVHPRFSPDGTYVLFTSDMTGYGNLYTVPMPSWGEMESLPLILWDTR